jgi:hypothetical protein
MLLVVWQEISAYRHSFICFAETIILLLFLKLIFQKLKIEIYKTQNTEFLYPTKF